MNIWNILGFGDYLNDIIDIIHLNGDRIGSLVIDDDPSKKEMPISTEGLVLWIIRSLWWILKISSQVKMIRVAADL